MPDMNIPLPDELGVDSSETNDNGEQEADVYADGEIATFIVTPARVWKPKDLKAVDPTLINCVLDMTKQFTSTDDIARRMSVLQTWEERHFDRGYQYLNGGNKGGWTIGGLTNSVNDNYIENQDDAGLHSTNIISSQGDIITGALNRGAIKVNFTPAKSKEPADIRTADEANKYKHIWYETNKSTELQREAAGLFWTDSRSLFWTRSIKDKARFGTVIDDSGQEEIRVAEVTTVHGVLETKLPMMRDKLSDCAFASIFDEVDYAKARAMFPWVKDKISPSTGNNAENAFEKIARINTRSGLVGKFLTGTANMRDVTICYSWKRPEIFYSTELKDDQREFFLKNFTTGLFAIVVNDVLVCCWEESMDDHLALGMATRGFGQNRRSLGSSDIPIQKRINVWAELWDKFIRGSIPITVLDDQAFSTEAMAELRADPQRFISAAVGEGDSIQGKIGQTPQAQPLPGFLELFQMYTGPLLQSIDGATPALFGGGEGQDNTVGATQIRLNQSLERVGPVWMTLNEMFATAISQAVKCCADNGNANLSGSYDDEDIDVKPENLKGNYKCKAETTNAIPESGTAREAKIMMILEMANSNQEVGAIIATPSNAREITKALHIDDIITIDEADSETKQLEEIELLVNASPLINPEWDQANKAHQELSSKHDLAKQLAVKATSSGQQISPDIIEQGNNMEQQVEQSEQQLSQLPQYIPSIPVEGDESVDHGTEAATCFSWMNGCDGRKLRSKALGKEFGDPDYDHFNNVFLHWKGHKDMMKTINEQNQQPQVPKLSLTGKATPDIMSAIAAAAGLQINKSSSTPPLAEQHTETINRTPFQEQKTKTIRKF